MIRLKLQWRGKRLLGRCVGSKGKDLKERSCLHIYKEEKRKVKRCKHERKRREMSGSDSVCKWEWRGILEGSG